MMPRRLLSTDRSRRPHALTPCGRFARLTLAFLTMALATGPPVLAQGGNASGRRATGPDHWAVKLGLRVRERARAAQTLDQVVLVPDAATFIDELARWSPTRRWPVLIEDDRLTPLFLRRFEPKRIFRRATVEGIDGVEPAVRRAVATARAGAIDADLTIVEALRREGSAPPGVVIASAQDPAWVAAAALAAGRGQAVVWIDDDWGAPGDVLDADRAAAMQTRIDDAIADLGWTWSGEGDEIEAITVCRAMATRASRRLEGGEIERTATTDLIGRTPSGRRYATTGWIFGDSTRSAYMAMCSLFLERNRIALLDGYPDLPQWGAYRHRPLLTPLEKLGYQVVLRDGEAGTGAGWMRELRRPLAADLVFINSHGLADHFILGENDRLFARDAPMLGTPAAVHMVHSFSAARPHDRDTIAGRWLDHGAYLWVGSVEEPFLGAFVPPALIMERMVNLVPLPVAARVWAGRFARPWRVTVIGDPLLLAAPRDAMPASSRGEPNPRANAPDVTDHRADVRAALEAAKASPSNETYGAAARLLARFGMDGPAAELAQIAAREGHGALAARWALGPLFRAGDPDVFVEAWTLSGGGDAFDRDLIWALLGWRLDRLNEAALLALETAVRDTRPERDLERLAPHLVAVIGRAHAASFLDREAARARTESSRDAIRALADQYR